jgi:hypothetical protein
MSNEVYIYMLCEPIDGEPRYVGKTIYPNDRYVAHIFEAKSGKQTLKCDWIRSLLQQNKKPVFEIIDCVKSKDWQNVEIKYIKEFKELGANLTNIAKGGEGFEQGFKQDQFFMMKKLFGGWYQKAVKDKDFKKMNRFATSMLGLAEHKPDLVPKRWKFIQLP